MSPPAPSALIPAARIQQAILLLRGQSVLLDRDLAALYGVETRALNQAVSRNAERFPPDFAFLLTREEIRRISQSVISSSPLGRLKYARSVRVFTEHGVAMLSSVLNSSRAIRVNIAIMRAFVQLRAMIASNAGLAARLDALEKEYDRRFKVVFDAIRELMESDADAPRKEIGYHTLIKPPAPRAKKQQRSSNS